MHARRALVRAVGSRIPKRNYVLPALNSTPNLEPEFEAREEEPQHAGPSNYLNSSRTSAPGPASLSDHDRENVAKLHEVVIRSHAERKDTSRHEIPEWDQAWLLFTSLTKETRNRLPVPLLKRALRSVVPPPQVVKQALVVKRNATHSTEAEISGVTAYPWEPRLQFVASVMRVVEERDRTSEGPTLSPEERALDVNDYHFVLRQLALTGHLSGSERVFKEMKDTGIPIATQIHEDRLMVLTKWLTIRKSVYQRFIVSQAREADSHTYGAGQPELARSTPFFPPDAVALFKDILVSMQEDRVEYRRFTYDLLLRIAKDTKNDKAADRLLNLAYNIDLAYPDTGTDALRSRMRNEMGEDETGGHWELLDDSTQASSVREGPAEAGEPPIVQGVGKLNTHALNTLIYRFAERGDLKGMLQAFEVFGQSPAEGDQVGLGGVQADEPVPGSEEDGFEEDGVDDEPVTLSEALAREEASGQRLGFFGGVTHPTVGLTDNLLPKFPVRPAADFLPPLPFPLEIESRTQTAVETDGVSADDLNFKDSDSLANTSTYRVLIKACAVQATLADSVQERNLAMTLGVHFLRGAVRELIIRHNKFLEVFVRINVATVDLKAPSLVKPDDAPRLSHRQSRRERSLRPFRTPVDLNPIRTILRKRLHPVKLGIDPELVLPLYKVLRSSRNVRGVPHHKRWMFKHLKEVQGLAEMAERYCKEEWQVMTGQEWVRKEVQKRPTNTSEPEPKGTIADLMQSLKEEAEREKEEQREEEALQAANGGESTMPPASSYRIVRPGSTLPPAFFTSDLAAQLRLPWTPETSPFSPVGHPIPPTQRQRVRFDLTKHLKMLKTHGRELEAVLEEQEASWTAYKEKVRTPRWYKKPVVVEDVTESQST